MHATITRPSVCLYVSVCPTIRPPQAAVAGLLLGPGGQEISIDCCMSVT